MDKKRIMSVVLVMTIVLAVVGFFVFRTVQQQQVEDFIARRQQVLKTGTAGDLQEGVAGKTYVTAFFPQQADGKRIEVIEEAIQDYISQHVTSKKPTKTIDQLLFVQGKSQSTDFANVTQILIKEERYAIKGMRIQKKADQMIGDFLVTNEGELFTLAQLFSNSDATKAVLAEALQSQLTSQGLPEETRQDRLSQLANLEWQQVPFAYENGQLVLTLPEEKVGVSSLQVPFASFFDSVDARYVPEAEKAAYDEHQVQKALRDGKVISLTFDDGPNPATTPRILDLLKQYNVRATFFVLGQNIPGNEDILKRIVAEGHEIANHTYTHPDLTTVSLEQVQQEIQQTQSAIEAAVGHKPTIMRPPYGAVNASVASVMGLASIHWSVDTLDWQSRNPEAIFQQVKTYAHPGGIVLMHDIHEESVQAVEPILQFLTGEGYHFATTSQLLGKDLDPHMVYFDRETARPAE